jgi:hypothetical protein
MSIPQATANVQGGPSLPIWPGLESQPFAFPVSPAFPSASATTWARDVLSGPWPSPASFVPPLTFGYASRAEITQVNGIWLFQETAQVLRRAYRPVTPVGLARTAVTQGLNLQPDGPQGYFTQHALLVAWGEFAHEIGLIQKLRQVPIPQKSVVHLPQAKVLTFFLGTLTGITHLRDLHDGPHPLAHDRPVLRAWGLAALAHYSGVSRTMICCGEKTVADITQVLHDVSQPFIDHEVTLLLAQTLPLILDLDLAPRRVSNTSTTFPDAQFGWQADQVGQGYDAALVSLTSPTYGRLFLIGFHYPRNPIALPRLQAMIETAEARLGRRPRRRVELVSGRLQALAETLTQRQAWFQAQLDQQQDLLAQLNLLPTEIGRLEAEVATLEVDYQTCGREPKPHSRLAQARHRLASLRKKLAQIPDRLQQAEQAATTHRTRLAALQAEYAALKAHLTRLEADNGANPEPVTMVARLDAGFGTGPNVAWLVEMGYWVYTKAYTAQVAARLKDQVTPDVDWSRVGRNAEMVAWDGETISECPYPLTLALERFHTPSGLKHSTLIAYRDDGLRFTLPTWFNFYNGRQIIEAGIKESNVVFQMHPLKMRSRGGIALQEQFALFAANFVRWAAVWLQERVVRSTPRFDDSLVRVKAMVRVATNTSAWLVDREDCLLVKFDDTGAFPGVELCLARTWRTRPLLLPREKVQKIDFRDAFASGCT